MLQYLGHSGREDFLFHLWGFWCGLFFPTVCLVWWGVQLCFASLILHVICKVTAFLTFGTWSYLGTQ